MQNPGLLANDRQKAQDDIPQDNCLLNLFRAVTELSAVVYIVSVKKAANTAQKTASGHPARETQ